MTRKRKNVVENQEEPKRQSFEQYGYVDPEPAPAEYGNKGGRFPKKTSGEYKKRSYDQGDQDAKFQEIFDKQYGAVGGDGSYERTDSERRERGDFPKELVSYLKSIDTIRKQEGKIEDFVMEKCGQEVVGQEVTLLEWTDAAVVVESVFGSSQLGAYTFLSALCKLKHKQLLKLIFSGTAARTIEKLMYTMSPVSQSEHVEVIEKFAELVCGKWSEAVVEKSAAFLLRCLIRVSAGLNSPPNTAASQGYNKFAPKAAEPVVSKFVNQEMKGSLKKVFDQIQNLAFDPVLNKDYEEDSTCSLVLQEVVEADAILKTRYVDAYVGKVLENSDAENRILESWKGINRSRFWEKLMEYCREETRTAVWMTISKNVATLASDQYANFPLQKLVGSVSSLELATEVVEDLSPSISDLMSNKRDGVVRCVVKCAAKHEDLQEKMIKALRLLYRASKVSNKNHFVFNLLTNNAYDGEHFDVNKCSTQGSLLLGELLKFSKVKTISACIEALDAQTIVQMATHKVASHVIQAILGSKTLPAEVKNKLVDAFEDHWTTLINDVYGSHVFEKIFFEVCDVRRKQEIMKKLIGLRGDSKFWKFAMVKCESYLFRKDRKAWVEKMKQHKR